MAKITVSNPTTRNRKRRRRTRKNVTRNARGRFVKRNAAAPKANRRRRARRNPVGGTLMTVTNRGRRRTRRRRSYSSRRRNPGGFRAAFKGISPKDIFWNTAGLIGVQTLTPTILRLAKQSETGPVAILGKVGTALLGYLLIGNVMKNKRAAQGFMQGGLISVGTDLWNVYIKPRLGLGGMYEFDSGGGGSMLGQSYMFEPMDQALLGVGECVPSERYTNPTDQVVVGASAGAARMTTPNTHPFRYTPVV
jgi:hypothetical protein